MRKQFVVKHTSVLLILICLGMGAWLSGLISFGCGRAADDVTTTSTSTTTTLPSSYTITGIVYKGESTYESVSVSLLASPPSSQPPPPILTRNSSNTAFGPGTTANSSWEYHMPYSTTGAPPRNYYVSVVTPALGEPVYSSPIVLITLEANPAVEISPVTLRTILPPLYLPPLYPPL